MSNKKYIRNVLLKFGIEMKSTNYTFLYPIGVLWFFLPILIWMIYGHYGHGEELYSWIIRLYQIFAPIMSVWCPLIISGEYIEGDGHELLYVYRKNIIALYIVFFNLSCLILAVPFVQYTSMYSNMILEYVRIVIECFFYCGACYMLVYVLRSISITFMVIIIYTLCSTYFGNGGTNIFIYYDILPISADMFKNVYLPLALIGLAFLMCGYIYNNNTERLTD